jgi:hypothetical protein
MMPNTRAATTLALSALLLATLGCTKREAAKPPETPAAQPAPPPPAPLAVASIDLGKAIGADKKVAAPTATFAARDTIYASVSTTGVGENATIGAKWTYVKADGSGTSVNESSQTITTTGPSATEFHITKASPWPKGKYRVEVLLNGASAGTKDFEVQ